VNLSCRVSLHLEIDPPLINTKLKPFFVNMPKYKFPLSMLLRIRENVRERKLYKHYVTDFVVFEC